MDLWGLVIGSVESTLLVQRVGCRYAQRRREGLRHHSIIGLLLRIILHFVTLPLHLLLVFRQEVVAKSYTCRQWQAPDMLDNGRDRFLGIKLCDAINSICGGVMICH